MTTQARPTTGEFCWMDLNTTDPEAAADFYRSLFGWRMRPWPTQSAAEGEAAGGYRQITYDDKVIGGAMALPDGQGMPSWNVFFAVDDADAAGEGIKRAGGNLLVGPTTAPGGGRVAFFTDAAGAHCGVVESGGGVGIECAMQPNTVCWVEAGSRDTEATRAFYADLFDWRFEELPPGAGADGYSLIHNRDRNFGGMIEMDDKFPAGVGSYWMIYIGVEDLDSTLAAVKREGGQLGFGPIEIPDGTFAVVSDPQGAHFAVIQPSPEAMARADSR